MRAKTNGLYWNPRTGRCETITMAVEQGHRERAAAFRAMLEGLFSRPGRPATPRPLVAPRSHQRC